MLSVHIFFLIKVLRWQVNGSSRVTYGSVIFHVTLENTNLQSK